MNCTKSRPLYETANDLQGEEKTCHGFCSKFGMQACKLPISYGLDYLLFADGKAVGFLEYKRRHFKVGDYDTVMLSLKKLMTAQQLKNATGLQSTFLVQFDNGIGSCCFSKFTEKPDLIEYGGRTRKTRDPQDIEPVVMIPMRLFQMWDISI